MLYDQLEREVIPEFYARNENGIPTAWTARMRESMARLTPRFSADRAVREYVEQRYIPAAVAYHARVADQGAVGRKMVDWQQEFQRRWATLHFGEVKIETCGERHVFMIQVCLGGLDPGAVLVELYANGSAGSAPARQEMKLVRQLADASGGDVYYAAVPATRPAADYTARVLPSCAGLAVPLENARILWQR